MNTEYSVRPIHSDWWQVAKFQGNKWPEAVYLVREVYRGGWNCDCPAREDCKHMRIVKEYIRVGQPHMNVFWVDRHGEVSGVYASFTTSWKAELEKIDEITSKGRSGRGIRQSEKGAGGRGTGTPRRIRKRKS
jgi:hypothetical protein